MDMIASYCVLYGVLDKTEKTFSLAVEENLENMR